MMDPWCRNKIKKYPAFSLRQTKNLPKRVVKIATLYFKRSKNTKEKIDELLLKRVYNEINDEQLYNSIKKMFTGEMPEDYRITMALAAYRAGKFKDAINILEKGGLPSRLVMARMYVAKKMYKKALKALAKIEKCRYASSIKAYCLIKLGKYKSAMNEIQQIKSLCPSWDILLYEAILLAKEMKYKEAIESIKKAIKLAPVSFVYHHAAKIALRAGRRKMAEQFLFEGGKISQTRDEILSFLKMIVKIGTRSRIWHSAACVIGYLYKDYTLLGLVKREMLSSPLKYIYDLAFYRADPYKAATVRAQCKNWIERAAFMLMI